MSGGGMGGYSPSGPVQLGGQTGTTQQSPADQGLQDLAAYRAFRQEPSRSPYSFIDTPTAYVQPDWARILQPSSPTAGLFGNATDVVPNASLTPSGAYGGK